MGFHARRFDRAAGSYGGLARIQADMAEALASLLPEADDAEGWRPLPGRNAVRVLELGCGTGNFTRRLREALPDADLLATDAAPRMLERAAAAVPGARFAGFDAEGRGEIPAAVLGEAPFDLVASNALVQWFPDFGAHLRMAAGLLAPGGLYLASGFLRDNFPELNAILAEAPFGYRDFPGHDRPSLDAAAADAGFAVEFFAEARVTETYPDARTFLARIKGLGSARRPAEGRPLTRGRLELLVETYRRNYPSGERDGGIRVTWRPWYARLRNRSP